MLMKRHAWFSRVEREWEAGNLKTTWREVIRQLGRFYGCRFGICPSHRLLAARARCGVRTVQRALQAARDLGLIDWTERRIKVAWRSLRTSNRYVLKLPPGVVQPARPRPPATNGQNGRGVAYERKSEEKPAHEMVCATLAAIAQQRTAAIVAAWHAKRRNREAIA